MISAPSSGAIRVSLTIGVPPTMSARLSGMREFFPPSDTGRTLSACGFEPTPRELIRGRERRYAGLLRLFQQRAHRLFDTRGAAARLLLVVALQLERDVDDAARVGDEVRR